MERGVLVRTARMLSLTVRRREIPARGERGGAERYVMKNTSSCGPRPRRDGHGDRAPRHG
ncbi:MAG: hypothetical protein M5U28_07670 [Sandaracinaceae bacterium]|nr:hypothetical protein [Sandaracinaceae bacterium]